SYCLLRILNRQKDQRGRLDSALRRLPIRRVEVEVAAEPFLLVLRDKAKSISGGFLADLAAQGRDTEGDRQQRGEQQRHDDQRDDGPAVAQDLDEFLARQSCETAGTETWRGEGVRK